MMKIKKNYLYAVLILVVIIIVAIFYYKPFPEKQKKTEGNINNNEKITWSVDKNGFIYYPLDRPPVKFRRDNFEETDTLLVSKVVYQSNRGNIYALLVLPKNITQPLPAIILLPGSGVSKESELSLAKKISGLGAAVLTLDQRGVGETDGFLPTLDDDYYVFLNATEPYQHLMVYDALRAFDLLRSASFIDSSRIIIAGESLGGRIAVITAGIDRNIKGVLVISSAGFDFKPKGDIGKDIFLQSIDSDHYIGQITPRRIVMIHNKQDKIIPLSSALNTYAKAQEPKRFVLVNDTTCNHGYCDSMYNGLAESLNYLVDI